MQEQKVKFFKREKEILSNIRRNGGVWFLPKYFNISLEVLVAFRRKGKNIKRFRFFSRGINNKTKIPHFAVVYLEEDKRKAVRAILLRYPQILEKPNYINTFIRTIDSSLIRDFNKTNEGSMKPYLFRKLNLWRKKDDGIE